MSEERKKSRHSSSRRSYKSSLFVRNLNPKLKPDELKKVFGKYAEVKDVYLPIDYKTKEQRGFGFIEFFNQEDARDALDKTNGMELEGNRISVMIAKEGRKTPSEMRTRDRRSRRSRSGGRRKKHRRSSSSRSSRSDSRSKKRSSRKKRDRKSSSRSSSASKKSRSRSSSADGHKKSSKNNTKKSSSRSKDKEDHDKRSASKDAKSASGSKSRSASRSKS